MEPLVSIYMNAGRFWQQILQILRSSRVGELGDNVEVFELEPERDGLFAE